MKGIMRTVLATTVIAGPLLLGSFTASAQTREDDEPQLPVIEDGFVGDGGIKVEKEETTDVEQAEPKAPTIIDENVQLEQQPIEQPVQQEEVKPTPAPTPAPVVQEKPVHVQQTAPKQPAAQAVQPAKSAVSHNVAPTVKQTATVAQTSVSSTPERTIVQPKEETVETATVVEAPAETTDVVEPKEETTEEVTTVEKPKEEKTAAALELQEEKAFPIIPAAALVTILTVGLFFILRKVRA